MHPALLAVVPSVFEQNEPVEQTLSEEMQYIPLNELQAALVPQEQSAPVLINAPLVLEQAVPREQVLMEESQ